MKTRLETGVVYVTCAHCNGTGIDDADWSGRCVFCDGRGEVRDEDSERAEEDDPDLLPTGRECERCGGDGYEECDAKGIPIACSGCGGAGQRPCRCAALDAEVARLTALLNAPELHDFSAAVVREAAHQRERWSAEHDAGKAPEDWFWLLGYLAGKALHAVKTGDRDKALHHTISSAAALANWHASIVGRC